jgi:hypothetical protein
MLTKVANHNRAIDRARGVKAGRVESDFTKEQSRRFRWEWSVSGVKLNGVEWS